MNKSYFLGSMHCKLCRKTKALDDFAIIASEKESKKLRGAMLCQQCWDSYNPSEKEPVVG